MAKELKNLSKQELIDLYKVTVEQSRDKENNIPLLSLCAAYVGLLQSMPPNLDKIELHFINTLANSIYSHYENSLVIKKAIEGQTIINKSAVLKSLGLIGIESMIKENSNQLLILIDCLSILYIVYIRDKNCDISGLISILVQDDKSNNGNILPNIKTNLSYQKFSNVEEYYQFLCDKLNEQGFKENWCNELVPWEVRDSSTFLSNLTANRELEFHAYKFLKDNGFFNMGICPRCGAPLKIAKYNFTSGFNSNINYPICDDCYNSGRRMSINPASDKKGCYIATVCYGDFNAPEVMVFRQYRDNVLSKNFLGRFFIALYYSISPSISNYLKGKETLNYKIKVFFLDKIYRRIK